MNRGNVGLVDSAYCDLSAQKTWSRKRVANVFKFCSQRVAVRGEAIRDAFSFFLASPHEVNS